MIEAPAVLAGHLDADEQGEGRGGPGTWPPHEQRGDVRPEAVHPTVAGKLDGFREECVVDVHDSAPPPGFSTDARASVAEGRNGQLMHSEWPRSPKRSCTDERWPSSSILLRRQGRGSQIGAVAGTA